MHGYDVVTSDDHKIGTVVGEENDCVIVEHGHVLKSRHAIPKKFVHVDADSHTVRATVTKDVVSDSPKLGDEWDCDEVMLHYGLIGEFVVDPDPESPEGITTDDHSGERVLIREGTPVGSEVPKVRERQANAYDPLGETSNLR